MTLHSAGGRAPVAQFLGLVPEALLTLALSAIFNYNERVRWRLNQLLGDELARLRQAPLRRARPAPARAGAPRALCARARARLHSRTQSFARVMAPTLSLPASLLADLAPHAFPRSAIAYR